MNLEFFLFLWLGFWLIVSSLAMIFVRNTVHCALLLILAFFSTAFLWLLLESEFLAITLILVYIGAIMVLFLFVIMMLDTTQSAQGTKFTKYLPLGLFVAFVVAVEMVLVLGPSQFGLGVVAAPVRHLADYSNITELALELYTIYVYPFELASILLLVAIISAITLVHRKGAYHLSQDSSEQISVKASERLHIIKDDFKESPK